MRLTVATGMFAASLLAGVALPSAAQAQRANIVCMDESTQQTVECPPNVVEKKREKRSKKKDDMVGGQYFVITRKGLPGGTPYRLTASDWDILSYLNRGCLGDLRVQRPSKVSELFHTTFVGLTGGGTSAAGSYSASGFAPVRRGALGAGVGGAIGGLVNGNENRKRANRSELGQCMIRQVYWIQQTDGLLLEVAIVINSHAIRGKPIQRPDEAIMNANPAPRSARPTVMQAPDIPGQ